MGCSPMHNENGFLLVIENDQEDDGVCRVAWRIFIGGGLRGKEEVEGAFNYSIVEKPIVRAIIARFVF